MSRITGGRDESHRRTAVGSVLASLKRSSFMKRFRHRGNSQNPSLTGSHPQMFGFLTRAVAVNSDYSDRLRRTHHSENRWQRCKLFTHSLRIPYVNSA